MDTKEKILKKTYALMAKKRGKDVRLVDIAKAAGVSRQAIYMHFGSRAGLLIATALYLDKIFDVPKRVSPVNNAATALEALDALVIFWGNYIPNIYGLAKAFISVLDDDKDAATAWDDRMTAVHNRYKSVVQRLSDEGYLAEIWSVAEATDFTWTLLHVSNWELLTIKHGWSQEKYLEHMQQTLRRTLIK